MKLNQNLKVITTHDGITHLYYLGSSLYFETGDIPHSEIKSLIEELQSISLDDIDIDSLCDIRSGLICSFYDYCLFEEDTPRSLKELGLVNNKILDTVCFTSFLSSESEFDMLNAHPLVEMLSTQSTSVQSCQKTLFLVAVSQHQYHHLERLHETLSTPWAAIIYDHFGFTITPVFGLPMGPCYNCYRMLHLSNLSSIDEHDRIERYFNERDKEFQIAKGTLRHGEVTLYSWVERLLSGKPYGDYDQAILFDSHNLDVEKVKIPNISTCNSCFE
ncbi:hypothetical protein MHO82_23325 [Vibrio sp. Of7-15]|uniref:hypothetical protein n=1 Tax=Vibrio sp. Of7-15 TaxID=2724879 RepID=UPI001EF2D6CB|nr:hypothetical protein [Vibrio sp. Of7-15]MCG7499803.1 hypothetical protein [Vibrio sp. Of7-15]